MDIIKNNAFIIAEYNPFHNGHKYHIQKTKQAGAENIICIMNGSFVQRGEPALCDKLSRAEAAIKNGADLVLELPLKYGISPANLFAYGGVRAAVCTGLDGTLSFGASASAEKLTELYEITNDKSTTENVKEISRLTGKTYPAALQEYVSTNYSCYAEMLSDANNTLGLEYIKALRETDSTLDYFTVDRKLTTPHDSAVPANGFASARFIRNAVIGGKITDVVNYMPENVFERLNDLLNNGKCTENRRYFSDVCLSRLYDCKAEYFTNINGVTQGLENRITERLKDASALEDLFDGVKTKRFTHARIRQIVLAAVLGITRTDLDGGVNYIRVLGFGDKGRELLKEMRTTAKVPVITNLSDINEGSSLQAQRDKETDILAGKLFELCRSVPGAADAEITFKPYFEH